MQIPGGVGTAATLLQAVNTRQREQNAQLAEQAAILSDTRSRLVQLADLREIFEVPNIVIGRGVKASDKLVTSDIWADNIVMAYVPGAAAGQQDARVPSFGYTLRRRGMPQTDTYNLAGGKVKVVLISSAAVYAPEGTGLPALSRPSQ